MIQIGIDYYPEHWDRSLWEEDAARMAELGVHTVRMAEFAWSRMAPRDGVFDFQYTLTGTSVVERNNYGSELTESTDLSGFGTIKIKQESFE